MNNKQLAQRTGVTTTSQRIYQAKVNAATVNIRKAEIAEQKGRKKEAAGYYLKAAKHIEGE